MRTKRLRLAMEMDKERKARLEKMIATTELMLAHFKGVVNVGVVLSLKPILKSWQLCLSFEMSDSLILLYIYLITYTLKYCIILISLIKLTITIHICMYVYYSSYIIYIVFDKGEGYVVYL